jgi:hypothetical protein
MNVANAMPVDPDPAATSTALTFGGQHIVCFGDFAQYRPVKQAWLGSTAAMPCAARQDTGRNTPKKRKLAKKSEDATAQLENEGRRIFRTEFTTVLELLHNYRQQHDAEWARFLLRLRWGDLLTPELEMEYLRPRIMGTPHTSPDITYAKWEWRTAEHLFSRHQVIAPFNTQAALRSALDLGATPTVYFARHDPPPSLEQMPCLPFYVPSGKGTTVPPGVLVFYPGQILRLQGVRANPRTGIVNGAKVKLLHIEISPEERSVLVPGSPRELTATPLFLKVRLLKPGKVRLQIPDLELDEFLIFPRKRRFTYLQPGPTPKAYKPQIPMTRTQFPVMTGSALTEFVAQGTVPPCVCSFAILCLCRCVVRLCRRGFAETAHWNSV